MNGIFATAKIRNRMLIVYKVVTKIFTTLHQEQHLESRGTCSESTYDWTEQKTKQHAYLMSSVLKLETTVLMKLSRMMTARIDFQSLAFSPSNKQMDSKANLTTAGGFAIVLISTSCCFLIDLTAVQINWYRGDIKIKL